MINASMPIPDSTQNAAAQLGTPRRVLRMVQNERMGGSVPVWETVRETASQIENTLENTLGGVQKASYTEPNAASRYQTPESPVSATTQVGGQDDFDFSDLLDMINPLQHIPVVGHIYRALSGDEIKPISHVVGGALFGGPLGAASGLVNMVIEEETGKDFAGNAFDLAFKGETPQLQKHSPEATTASAPEIQLAEAQISAATRQAQDLPGSLLSFVDMQAGAHIKIERIDAAEGRTAGQFDKTETLHAPYPDISMRAPREPITQVRLSPYKIY